MTLQHNNRLFPLFAVAVGSLVALAAAEAGFRIYFGVADTYRASHSEYRLMSTAFGQFDAEFGQRFRPNSRLEMTLIRDGRAAWCAGTIASANGDGLGGRDTLEMFRNAEFRLITAGDSFTYRQQEGLTIPDLVGETIGGRTGLTTANLNYGRGAYGVLQMLSIAAAQAAVVRPDVIVIAFISNDLTRGRWWSREAPIGGRAREQLSTAPDTFDDPAQTLDEYVVDARATTDFCTRAVASGGDDPIVREANAFFREYRKAKGLDRDPLSFQHFYVFESVRWRLTGRDPNASAFLPQVDFKRFAADAGFRDSVRMLRESPAPVVLIHLPVAGELAHKGPILDKESSAIWAALERNLSTRIVTFWTMTNPPLVPPKIDQAPFDAHPNLEGLRFYGEYVARALLEDARVQRAVERARRIGTRRVQD